MPEPRVLPLSAEWRLAAESVFTDEAQSLLRAFRAEVAEVTGIRDPAAEVSGAVPVGASEDLRPPDGAFWVARLRGAAVGCVGLRVLDPSTAELKRMYVAPAARGRRLGTALLAVAERAAAERGVDRIVLDTRSELVGATALYERHGYLAVSPYNSNPEADRWYAKPLR
ncbi:GNAT family N-acetyltransferase [Streptomyces sparsus]